MTDTSNAENEKRDLANVVDDEPQSKHGRQGQAEHDHEKAGPNSDAYGETIAPQKGNLRDSDRAKGS